MAFTGTSGTITLASLSGNGTTAFSAAAILPFSSSSGTVNLNAPAASLIVSTGTQSGALLISGQGGLVKTGTDTVTIGVANTYTGGTTLNAGTLVATNLTLPRRQLHPADSQRRDAGLGHLPRKRQRFSILQHDDQRQCHRAGGRVHTRRSGIAYSEQLEHRRRYHDGSAGARSNRPFAT